MNPKVSVIINCYNGYEFLTNSIESVLNQDFMDFELIIWDNLSTDNSAILINSYNDTRIRYIKSDSHDILGKARNRAIQESRGAFIAFLEGFLP